jgi:hypothetical protein
VANLYGVANAPGLPVLLGGGNFTGGTCNAGTYTQIGTSPALIAPSPGYFYALVILTLEMTFGATTPSTLFFACSIGAGSATNAVGIGQIGLIANSGNIITAVTNTPVSQVAWQGAGSTVGFWLQPGAQSCTVATTSTGLVLLMRAPDQ